MSEKDKEKELLVRLERRGLDTSKLTPGRKKLVLELEARDLNRPRESMQEELQRIEEKRAFIQTWSNPEDWAESSASMLDRTVNYFRTDVERRQKGGRATAEQRRQNAREEYDDLEHCANELLKHGRKPHELVRILAQRSSRSENQIRTILQERGILTKRSKKTTVR